MNGFIRKHPPRSRVRACYSGSTVSPTSVPAQAGSMHFRHSDDIWQDFPELVPGVLWTGGISADARVAPQLDAFQATARARLAAGPESELPEINAWRRVFSRMGLKPTQYRCA